VIARGGMRAIAVRAVAVLAAVLALAFWQVSAGSEWTPTSDAATAPGLQATSSACAATVLGALGHVAMHIYHEGVSSEETATARHFIVTSRALRTAVEHDDAGAARRAAQAVLATGHLRNLRVIRGRQVLADLGAPDALAPVRGTLRGAHGRPIGSFLTSVWSDYTFLAQTGAITEGVLALRAGGQSIGGSFALPPGELATQGAVIANGVDYQYTSFPGEIFPAGKLRVYLLMPVASTARFCGRTGQDTVVKTISRVAALIYAGETGPQALIQVHRVQRNVALLQAVARRDRAATRRAIVGLLNQHIVRLRVIAGGHLLGDVGGPFVLAPKTATLQLGGVTIGNFVLSIQDDLGYLLLAHRLAGLEVIMHRGRRVVMSSLGGAAPSPASFEASYRYRGRKYRVFTVHATAFPSGPLRITVLMPIPYS
jgi:hypothetical protein